MSSGLTTVTLLTKQLVLDNRVPAAAQEAAISVLIFAVFMITSSLISLLNFKCPQTLHQINDTNFRQAVLMKALLLVAKTMLLSFPEQSEIVDMRFIWSCVPQLCPSSCTGRAGGYCVKVSGECRCESSRPDNLVLAITTLTSAMIGSLTVVDFVSIVCKRRRFIHYNHKRLVGILLCNLIYLIGLVLAVLLPISVFSRRPFAAGVFALPLVPLALLVNENKWMIHGFRERTSDVPAIREEGGLKIILCTFLVLVVIATGLLWEEIAHTTKQPMYTQPHDGKYSFMAYLGVATLVSGALAALLLI